KKGEVTFDLVPERLRGETAAFDIKIKGKVLVEEGRRVTARHIRELEKAGVDKLEVPVSYLVGKIIAHDVLDLDSGEIVARANDELTSEQVEKIIAMGIDRVETIYVN